MPTTWEGTRQLKSRVDALKLFCLLYIFCKFFSLLLKGHVVSTKVKKRKKKTTVAFCVYIVLFLQVCSWMLCFKVEMKYIMNFFKKTHQISGYHKTLLYYYTAHYLLYVIDI